MATNKNFVVKHGIDASGTITGDSFTGAGTGLTGYAANLSIGGVSTNVTGIVQVVNGGTGANNAPQARLNLGAAPIDSPKFVGTPTAPTVPLSTVDDSVATTLYVRLGMENVRSNPVSSALRWTNSRTLSLSGDATMAMVVDGTEDKNAVLTLATVNSNVGTFGNASSVGSFTVNEKGLVTAASTIPIVIDAAQTTTGSFANARISQASVVQHQAALTIAETQIPNGTLLARLADDDTVTGNWTFSNPVTGVDPVGATHLATKQYVDNLATGLDFKASVKVATTANIALTGTQTIDGVALVAGDRVLVKDQTNGTENGIYVVASGAWTRATDADNSPGVEISSGMYCFVEQGNVSADTGWVLTTNGPITLGTTSLAFVQFTGLGQITAGNGLAKSGSTIFVQPVSSSRITATASGIDLAVVNSNVGTFGNATSFPVLTVTDRGTVTAVTTQTLNTTNVAEGSNLYYTDARARASVGVAGVGLSYNATTGVITSNATSSNTGSTIVSRAADGSFSSSSITVQASDAAYVLKSQNSSASNAEQFNIKHNLGVTEVNSLRGNLVVAASGDITLTTATSGYVNTNNGLTVGKVSFFNGATSYTGYASALNLGYTGSGSQFGITMKPATSTADTNALVFLKSTSTANAPANNGSIQHLSGDTGMNLAGTWNINNQPIAAIPDSVQKAGDTMNGTLFTRLPSPQATVTTLTGAPLDVREVTLTAAGFAPALHQKTLLNTGYRQHLSLGTYRSNSAWGGGFYVALGGNDANPTENFLLNYGGEITHSSGKTFLNSSNFNSYAPTLTGTGASGTWGINVTGNLTNGVGFFTPGSSTWGRNNGEANVLGSIRSGSASGDARLNIFCDSGVTNVYVDGDIYTNEGQYKVMNSNNFTSLGAAPLNAPAFTGGASVSGALTVSSTINNTLINRNFIANNVGNVSYMHLCTLPQSTIGTYDNVTIDAVVGGWEGTNKALLNIVMGNRAGFTYSYQVRGNNQTLKGVVAFQQADGSVTVYGYAAANTFATFNADIRCGVGVTLPATQTVLTSVPSGTIVFDSGTPATYPPSNSVDFSNNFYTSGRHVRSVSPTVTAAGTTQATATQLARDINVVTSVAASSGVVLPATQAGLTVIVMNKGANALNVYPPSGGAVDALGTNVAYSLPVGAKIMFIATTATQWDTLNATYS